MMTTTNSLGIQTQGVVYFDGSSVFTGIDGSTSGFVLTSNGTGIVPSFQAVPSTIVTWQIVTSATNVNPTAKDNGYFSGGALQVVFILPSSAVIGDTFVVSGYLTLFQITQNALQSVIVAGQQTTVGTMGTITSNNVGDHIEITYIGSNTFKATNIIGTLSIV